VLSRTLILACAIAALWAAPALAGPTKTHGTFQTLPAGTAMGLDIDGTATLTRSAAGTEAKIVVKGLTPATTYAAHLHNAPCSAADPGGSHYKNDPAGPSMPPNELWLSSTDDPTFGIRANSAGVAHARGSADWVARPEAQSIVVHAAGGSKIACADLK
jgi:large repetitive protein